MNIEIDDVARKFSDMNTLALVRTILTDGHIQAKDDEQLRDAISKIVGICAEQERRLYRGYETLSSAFREPRQDPGKRRVFHTDAADMVSRK